MFFRMVMLIVAFSTLKVYGQGATPERCVTTNNKVSIETDTLIIQRDGQEPLRLVLGSDITIARRIVQPLFSRTSNSKVVSEIDILVKEITFEATGNAKKDIFHALGYEDSQRLLDTNVFFLCERGYSINDPNFQEPTGGI